MTVTEVVDGDTIDMRYPNGTNDTVRLLWIDTPEVHMENDPDEFEGVPETSAGASCLREGGHEACEFVKQTLQRQEVRLEFDRLSDRRGSYGRLLAYVYIKGGISTSNWSLMATIASTIAISRNRIGATRRKPRPSPL